MFPPHIQIINPDESGSERTEEVLENILRWEDDGGKFIETNKAVSNPIQVRSDEYTRTIQR